MSILAKTKCLLSLTAFSVILVTGFAQAEPSMDDWTAFNTTTMNSHVIPRYQQLETAASKLHAATSSLCQNTNEKQLSNAQQVFHKTMDAWQSIQHIRSGPVELLMRGYSMQFWPDKKGHVSKKLSQLLKEKDPSILTEEGMYSMSVAVRGLPAIERLLFDPQALTHFSDDAYRCQLLNQIAAYVDEMGQGMANEWQTMMPKAFAEAGLDEESLYDSQQEISVLLLKPIVESLEVIKDLKIKRVLGSEFGKAKMKRLESWRSERSLNNIRLNIAAVNAIYLGENGASVSLKQLVTADHQEKINALIKHIDQSLTQFDQPIEQTVSDEAGYKSLVILADDIEKLLKAYQAAIADTGLFLGFNSRDGD